MNTDFMLTDLEAVCPRAAGAAPSIQGFPSG